MTDAARVAALEAAGRAALPALAEREVAGWLLRVSGGATKRVNSLNPLAQAAPIAAALPTAEATYREHGLPYRVRLTPLAPAEADAALAARGYAVVDASLTMVAPLHVRAPDPAVALTGFSAAAAARVAPLSGRSPAEAAAHARLIANIPGPLAFASIEANGRPIAAGLASVGGDIAQLADIAVAPGERGRGLGRRLVERLLGWAYAQGCSEAMLQVLETNDPARRLYRSLGFVDAYPYHYRLKG